MLKSTASSSYDVAQPIYEDVDDLLVRTDSCMHLHHTGGCSLVHVLVFPCYRHVRSFGDMETKAENA